MIYICLSIKTTAMKKIFAALILILSFVCAYGQDYAEITMSRTDTRTRGIIEVPEASISHELLVVSFPSSGLYSLYIEDGMGNIVYTSTLPADGMEYGYDLSGIGEGFFTLTLEGPSGEYKGEFSVN